MRGCILRGLLQISEAEWSPDEAADEAGDQAAEAAANGDGVRDDFNEDGSSENGEGPAADVAAIDPLVPTDDEVDFTYQDPTSKYYHPQSPYRLRSNLLDVLSPETQF